jgi:hypothetical protein
MSQRSTRTARPERGISFRRIRIRGDSDLSMELSGTGEPVGGRLGKAAEV